MMTPKKVFLFLIALVTLASCQENDLGPSSQGSIGDQSVALTNGFLGLRQSTNSNRTANADNQGTTPEIDCFAINYPVEILMPGQQPQTVNSDEEVDALITPWFEDQNNWYSTEFPTFSFPISVTLEDGSVVSVADDMELCDIFFGCYDQWEDWVDEWDENWDDDNWDDWYDDEEDCDEDEDEDEDDDEDDDDQDDNDGD